jgi:hypothetical protein
MMQLTFASDAAARGRGANGRAAGAARFRHVR